jgi:hypothetical protein
MEPCGADILLGENKTTKTELDLLYNARDCILKYFE